ncbi:MAG: VapE domain-containing protein, partial [Dolichospermum sp.]
EIDGYGSPNFIYNKGDQLWGAYRIEEVLHEISSTDGTPMILFQEGEGCVEIARSLGIASTCVDGSGWTTEGLTFAIKPIREIGAGIIYLADNDVPGNKKAKQVEDVCNTLQIPCIVIKASAICDIPDGGDIKEIMEQRNKEDFIERLQNEIHRAVESRSVVALDGGGDGDDDKIPQSRLARHFSLVKEGWGDKLRFNQLTKEIELAGNELNEDEVRLTMALDFDIDVSNADAHSIINRLAKADEYSPVVEYLDAISQKYNDIDPSFLDGLSLKYFGSSEPMHAIYLKKFLVGAVARARNPGCKLDTVLMLVGAQGCGKSAFLENLFGRRFFTDQIGGELNDKDEKAKVSRYWCLEYAEFEAVYKKRDVSSLKRFITAKEDTFRAPYARKEARHPRPSLFAGTTNETEILLDPTGDRRFWVLKVEIDKIP